MDYAIFEGQRASVWHRCGPNLYAFDGSENWSTQHRHRKACHPCRSVPWPFNHHAGMKIKWTEGLLSNLHWNPGKTNKQNGCAMYIISQTFKRKKDWLQHNSYYMYHSDVLALVLKSSNSYQIIFLLFCEDSGMLSISTNVTKTFCLEHK